MPSDTSDWIEVASSNISAVRYQPILTLGKSTHGLLSVRFANNTEYVYRQVPHIIYESMVRSESVGKFFHANIKGKYEFVKLITDKDKTADTREEPI